MLWIVVRNAGEDTTWAMEAGTSLSLTTLAFADDIALVADKGDKLQRHLNIWEDEPRKRSLMINVAKTQSMVITREKKVTLELKVRDEDVVQVTVFKYLGSHISEDGQLMEEINSRIGAAATLDHSMKQKFLKKQDIVKSTKFVVYKTVYTPTRAAHGP